MYITHHTLHAPHTTHTPPTPHITQVIISLTQLLDLLLRDWLRLLLEHEDAASGRFVEPPTPGATRLDVPRIEVGVGV